MQGCEQIWALIDCNNFFVSCERVFRPDLWEQPVLVLSSNDGCTVSRSAEVKKLGIAMGAPKFQIEDVIKKHGVRCFSSNFRLYGDMSGRVMRTIREAVGAPNQEIYSIDECFVRGEGLGVRDWEEWGRALRQKIGRETGIPVTIGIAPTKTLAKLAGEIAKKDPLGEGVMYWSREDQNWREQYLEKILVSEVWGVGRQLARRLFGRKINTVQEFVKQEQKWVRKEMGLGGEKTWRELRGESCIEAMEAIPSHKQILRSRSFGEGVTAKAELRRAVAEYATIATENLRRNRLRASMVSVFIKTSYFADKDKSRSEMVTLGLSESTSYLPDIMKAAERALERAYQPGFVYKKAGVILSALESEDGWQPALMGEDGADEEKKQKIMKAVDKLNHYYGGRKVNIGFISSSKCDDGSKVVEKWQSKSTMKSREYSTNWEELRVVR